MTSMICLGITPLDLPLPLACSGASLEGVGVGGEQLLPMGPQSGRAEQGDPEVSGCDWYICIPTPGLLPSTFPLPPGQGEVASFLTLIKGCRGHTQHQAREMVAGNQPVYFIMALALAVSGQDLEVRSRGKGDSTMTHFAEHLNIDITQGKVEKILP